MSLEDEIGNLDAVILAMSGQVEENLSYAIGVYTDYQPGKKYPSVEDYKVNAYERQAEEMCLQIMLRERLFASDMRKVTGIMTMVEDLERLGDHAEDVLQFALKLKNADYDGVKMKNLAEFCLKMVHDAIDSYIRRDCKAAKEVIGRDDYVDKEYAEIIDYLIKEDKKKAITPEFAIYTTLVVKYLERIADHATNIAEWAIYIVTGYYKDKQIL
jgi:phosphate transport system protein